MDKVDKSWAKACFVRKRVIKWLNISGFCDVSETPERKVIHSFQKPQMGLFTVDKVDKWCKALYLKGLSGG